MAMTSETKGILMERISQDSDFPAMSQTVTLLNKLESSNDSSSNDLSGIILTDYALTLKIIRLVNSVGYLQFGEVTTISRAIMLLGFENIRNIALTLLLFDHLDGTAGTKVRELLLRAICSGILARNIATETGFTNVEEAFICSLFHSLGKILVAFYMPEKIGEITKLSAKKGVAEDVAALSVLGSSYEAIGAEISGSWNLPRKVVYTMKKIRPSEIGKGPGEMDRLCSIANFSNEILMIMASSPSAPEREEKITKLMDIYKLHFGDIENINHTISSAAAEATKFAAMFRFKTADLSFYSKLTKWGIDSEETATETPAIGMPEGISSIAGILDAEKESGPDNVLSKGVQEINTAILNDYPLNEVIKIALETMYRGMNFSGSSKVLFLLRDSKGVMKIKFGFGGDQPAMKQWFEVSMNGSGDIFNLALSKPIDLVIKDIAAPDIKPLLPSWYAGRISDGIFVIILPIVINKNPLGLFYIEGETAAFGRITAEELKSLTMLRDQTVLSIKQKHSL
jgi:eukaryotic-like serine/threonine-protein kinase